MKKMLDESVLENVTGGAAGFGSSVEKRKIFCFACNQYDVYSTGDIYEDGCDWVADCKHCGEMVFWSDGE